MPRRWAYADVGVVGARLVDRPADEAEGVRIERFQSLVEQLTHILGDGRPRLELVHQTSFNEDGVTLPWSWESSGTQALVQPGRRATAALTDGALLIVDDLGGDLHPLLTAQFVGLFQDRETNPKGAQLVFTGHDVNLLGKHVEHRLRRDQVWLTAKERDGATKLYPLTEYGRVRDGLDDVEGRYLQGRYGAVPFFDRSLLEYLRADAEDNEHGA